MLEIIQQKHLHALLHKTKSFQFQPIFIGNYLDSICKLWNADFCFFLKYKNNYECWCYFIYKNTYGLGSQSLQTFLSNLLTSLLVWRKTLYYVLKLASFIESKKILYHLKIFVLNSLSLQLTIHPFNHWDKITRVWKGFYPKETKHIRTQKTQHNFSLN